MAVFRRNEPRKAEKLEKAEKLRGKSTFIRAARVRMLVHVRVRVRVRVWLCVCANALSHTLFY